MASHHEISHHQQLHIFFMPFMSQGHMIPLIDMAKLFSARGVKTTIITTPLNAPLFSNTIRRTQNSGLDIHIQTIEFPSIKAGLPEGCENLDSITSSREPGTMMMAPRFFIGVSLLQEPLEKLMQEQRPDCLVADFFFHWATESAQKFGIPRLVFHGSSFFSSCVFECLWRFEPYKKVDSDSEPFLVPDLPAEIVFTRDQLPDFVKQDDETEFNKMFRACKEAEVKGYGVVFNSFYELEPEYADYLRNVVGRKAWHIGPVALCNRADEDKAERGMKLEFDQQECLKWLDSKNPNSVVYICFGSVANFTAKQLKEIALGVEAAGQDFIWVVRRSEKNDDGEEDFLPQGFEKRMEGKGMIIRGWAPQLLILDHPAVGGFVTHCGWNSTVEGVAAGVAMVTWPVGAEQVFNEKLVTEVLKIGVAVGVRRWVRLVGDFVGREAIERAVKEIMVGEKSEEMRSRAKAYGEMAKRAVENGGSSYSDLNALIEELSQRSINNIVNQA